MVNTVNQTKLLNSLINSDLLFFTNKSNKHIPYFNRCIKLNRDNKIILLDLFILLQSLKQLVRVVQYASRHLTQHPLQIVSENKMFLAFIDFIFQKLNIHTSNLLANSSVKTHKNIKTLIFLNAENNKAFNKYSIKRSFDSNINIMFLIGNFISKQANGTYKMFAGVDTYKKLVCLTLIILLSQNKNTIN